ncbi:MAG: GNAT family N-acetyltransferase [Acidobacteriota bacterium]
MEIRKLRNEDQARLEDFVLPRINSSIFLLANSRQAGLIDRGERLEGTYFAAIDSDRIVGVIAHYWLGNLVLQAPESLPELMAAVQAADVRPILGLLGPGDQVAAAKAILDFDEERVQLDEQEGLYALDLSELVIPDDLCSGRLSGRRIQPRDLDRVTEWRIAYHLALLGAEDTPELRAGCRDDMAGSCERGDTWVLEDGGEVVASTSFNAVLDEVVQVGGVWTPPESRGRGYGRAVVAVSLIDARDEGVGRSVLFTGDENLGARKAYAALGYQRIGDYRITLFRE